MTPGLRSPARYHVLAEHGRGGLGKVTRALDRELGRNIAIKELITRNQLSEVRFMREALITARLEHPGIVPVYEAGHWPDGTPFYAMKLVSGRSLRELLGERKTVDERLALLHHVIAVAESIAYAHNRNIIHRDLKPGNVIIGEFGETVVIDWGLAKDLTGTDEHGDEHGPFRGRHGDDLTAVGAVLGTPAYMSPEQERGESVDQRADVFAIGAMLWELCSLVKAPPRSRDQRRRLLRDAGIDEDLTAIIQKALDPDLDRRYPDAGAFAADLRAFTAGARIAARRYSPWAMLVHWIRRHRAQAASAAVVVALGISGIIFYLRSVTTERDRADRSEDHAKRSLDDLTLKHAQLLLATDPSQAIDALASYRGSNIDHARRLTAEARGRGVAVMRATPHTSFVAWATGTASGEVVSLSADGTLVKTSSSGASVVIARDVADLAQFAYSPSRHLLVYTCDPEDVCIYDLLHTTRIPTAPVFHQMRASTLAFSQGGTLLAIMTKDKVLKVVDVTDPTRPALRLSRPADGGTDAIFIEDNVIATHTAIGLEFVQTDQSTQPFPITGNSYWDSNFTDRQFATATTNGQALVFEGTPLHVAARTALCHGPVSGLQFIAGRHGHLAYACRNGTVGIWEPHSGIVTPRVQLEGHAEVLTVSHAGDYVIAGGGNGTVTVLDLTTDLATTYRGHKFRLTSITPPTREFPFIISADVSGAVRTWPVPARFARVAMTSDLPLHSAIFDRQSGEIAATTFHPALTIFSSTGTRSAGPHNIYNIFLEQSATGATFAAYGYNEHIELWSSKTKTLAREIDTKQGTVSQLRFVGATEDVIVSGHDGRLIRRSLDGRDTVLAQIALPIVAFAYAAAADSAVFAGADGALWRTAPGGASLSLQRAGARVISIVVGPDERTVYCGASDGTVIEIDTKTWHQAVVLRAAKAIQQIATTIDGRHIAVVTSDDVLIGTIEPERSPARWNWTSLMIRMRTVAIAPDGLLVGLETNGTIWFYSIGHRAWACLPAGTTDLTRVAINDRADAAVTLDVEGRLIWIELNAARQLLENFN